MDNTIVTPKAIKGLSTTIDNNPSITCARNLDLSLKLGEKVDGKLSLFQYFTLNITATSQTSEPPIPPLNLSKGFLYKDVYNNKPPLGACISKRTQKAERKTR